MFNYNLLGTSHFQSNSQKQLKTIIESLDLTGTSFLGWKERENGCLIKIQPTLDKT